MKLFLLHFPAIQFKGIDLCAHEGTWGQDYGWTPASSAAFPPPDPLCGQAAQHRVAEPSHLSGILSSSSGKQV